MASSTPAGSIVVGVDGSKESSRALEWAADKAQRVGAPLHLLHATNLDWLVAASLINHVEDHPTTDELLDAASGHVRASFPDLRVTAQATTGSAAHDLVKASARAAEVVVGAHGRTAGHPAHLGSVAHAVAMHAACPVVVVRGTAAAHSASGPVVVGVDGSPVSPKAIDYALEHAAQSNTSVIVLHAWWLEFVEGVVVTTPGSPEWQRAEKLMRLKVDKSLAGRRTHYPDVEVSVRLVRARPAEALVEASQDASLVVVGARGRGGFAALLLGSVSREVLMNAAAPVAVVRL